jgi:hypothetical protein
MPNDSVKIEMLNQGTGEWVPLVVEVGSYQDAADKIDSFRAYGSKGQYRIVTTVYFPYTS